MCSLTLIALGIGAAISAAGALQQAKSASQAAKANANIADMNARIASERADDAIRRGEEEVARVRRESAQEQGALTVQLAGGNLDLGFGSPLAAIIGTATLNELDAERVRSNAAREATDFDQQRVNQTAQASIQRASGKNALIGGAIGALGSVVGGVGTVLQSRAAAA